MKSKVSSEWSFLYKGIDKKPCEPIEDIVSSEGIIRIDFDINF